MIGSRVMSTPAKSLPMFTISRSASSVRLRGTFVMSSQMPEPLGADAAALEDLGLLGARDDVARGELHLVGRVLLHEALALGVQQHRALAARALGDQEAVLDERRRVVLDHLHVHQRRADPVGLGDPVAGHDQSVGRRAVDLPGAAAGEDHVLRVECLHPPRADVARDHPAAAARRRPGAARS